MLWSSKHLGYLQKVCRELQVALEYLRNRGEWASAIPLNGLDSDHLRRCAHGSQELLHAIQEACNVNRASR